MTFISIKFLLFVVITVLLYFLVPLESRWIVLLISSAVFYGFAGLEKIPYVLITAMTVYLVTRKIEQVYENDTKDKKRARKWLILGLLVTLGMLCYAKIGHMLTEAVCEFWGEGRFDIVVIVPLGISYYTFSVIGYMADVYWKKDKAEHNFLKMLLYMIYFPQILQGPIPKHKKLAGQLTKGHIFDYQNFCYGLQRMVWGYFKKMVIADRLSILTSTVFGNYEQYAGQVFIVAAVSAAIELYCDFSGCMDIALGFSEIISIRLDENFRRPFYSKTASEFWRRWHITLGVWFKDYVYMPMVTSPGLMRIFRFMQNVFGKRFAKRMLPVIPMAAVWLLTGLWHGTGWNYVAWGCYWGLLIIISSVFMPEIRKVSEHFKINLQSPWFQRVQIIRTFILFVFSRLLTAPDGGLKATVAIIKSIILDFNPWIYFDQTLYSLGLDNKDFWVGVVAILILWLVDSKQEKGISIRDTVASWPLVVRWAIYYAGIFAVLIFGIYGSGHPASTFVYMQY